VAKRKVVAADKMKLSGPVNPKDRFGLVKVPALSVVPTTAILYIALAQRDGAMKYGPYNWRGRPIRISIFLDAAMRHLLAWIDGEECAEDSKVPHLAHALACLAIIADAMESGNAFDDRPAAGPAARLLAKWERPELDTRREDAASGVVQRAGVSRKSRRRMAESRESLEQRLLRKSFIEARKRQASRFGIGGFRGRR
jgi:hypothetical protein